MRILLSINPEHVENILEGKKRFEFRKVRCRSEVTEIFVYSTSPIMRVVAKVEVKGIIEGRPDLVWERTEAYAGISKGFYDKYYFGKQKAVAYELGGVVRFSKPKTLKDFGINAAPQSFVYV